MPACVDLQAETHSGFLRGLARQGHLPSMLFAWICAYRVSECVGGVHHVTHDSPLHAMHRLCESDSHHALI
jgi:hypothetical protein